MCSKVDDQLCYLFFFTMSEFTVVEPSLKHSPHRMEGSWLKKKKKKKRGK